jgi:acetyl-CoA acyltransferase
MKSVVIAAYARSPYHFANKGELARVRPDELAAQTVAGMLAKLSFPLTDIEDVIVGCAFPEGEQGMNVARLISFLSQDPQLCGGHHGQPFLWLIHAGHSPSRWRDSNGGGRGLHLRRH